jgi:Na+-driven multidrug efflux pump
MASGLSKQIMHISVVGAVVNIVLNYIFIKLFGLGTTGAAIATMISYFLINILNSLVLYRSVAVHPITLQYLKPVAGSAVTGIVLYVIAKSLPLHLWMLPLYLLLFFAGYMLSLVLTRSVDREDLDMMELIFRRLRLPFGEAHAFLSRFVH